MKISNVLYPTDFSNCSRQALAHAAYLAERFDAELHMYHAVVLNADDADPAEVFPDAEALMASLAELSDSRLAGWIPEERRGTLRVKEVHERGFSAWRQILEYAGENDVDIIVMGTHGRGAMSRVLLGSVAERVLQHAECPVLTTRESKDPRDLDAPSRILVPVDLSEHSAAAVSYGKEMAAIYGATLQVLHVVHVTASPTAYGRPKAVHFERLEPQVREAVDEVVAGAAGPDVQSETHVVTGRAATRIVSFAAEQESDLIVIPSHGLTGLASALLGSTVAEVVRQAQCPVLTIKPHGKSLLG